MLLLDSLFINQRLVHFHRRVETKCLQIQKFVEWNVGVVQLHLTDCALGVVLPYFLGGSVNLAPITQVHLIEQHLIGEANLLHCFILTTLFPLLIHPHHDL